jgi:ergothioneine biosynthesis protein EgtB
MHMKARASEVALRRTGLSAVLEDFLGVRQATLDLCNGLSPEDCALQSMPDASPVKWHLGHTSWFFETFILEKAISQYRHFNREFRVLFNSYYVTVGERHPRPERGLLSRPGFAEILAYREHVNAQMEHLLRRPGMLSPELADLIELGMHHEQQHQELIVTDLKHLLSRNPLKPRYRKAPPKATEATATTRQWHAYPDGLHHIGHDGNGFFFDNERPRHRVFVGGHELAHCPVTNAEYLAFIADGGYTRPELWLSEGWDTVRAQSWIAPLYWEQHDGDWTAFTAFGMQKIDVAAPVCHVSYYEADAYARWTGARLPTEAEWEVAARNATVEGNFADNGLFHPQVGQALQSDEGPSKMFGDVWEWTQSAYAPYPGYKTPAGAVGEYNGKFMVNQYVLRGGSCATPRSHIRAPYRNFFPAAARWQFSGIRLARDS